jgi:hypothetical protein
VKGFPMLRTFSFVVLMASTAFASGQFPGLIQTKYGLAASPPQSCSLCHVNGITAVGTVNTPIGTALRARGLMLLSDSSLMTALDQLAADAVDSDKDGVTDVAELMAGTNPNVADQSQTDGGTGGGNDGTGGGGGSMVPPAVRYGCGAQVMQQLLLLAGLVPLFRRGRRAR